MAVSLHQALFQGLKKEQGSVLLIALLRALSTLLSAAPYPRLPEELVPSALQVSPLLCVLQSVCEACSREGPLPSIAHQCDSTAILCQACSLIRGAYQDSLPEYLSTHMGIS